MGARGPAADIGHAHRGSGCARELALVGLFDPALAHHVSDGVGRAGLSSPWAVIGPTPSRRRGVFDRDPIANRGTARGVPLPGRHHQGV